MTLFDHLPFWLIVGLFFFFAFGVIVVTAFLSRSPSSRRGKRRDRD